MRLSCHSLHCMTCADRVYTGGIDTSFCWNNSFTCGHASVIISHPRVESAHNKWRKRRKQQEEEGGRRRRHRRAVREEEQNLVWKRVKDATSTHIMLHLQHGDAMRRGSQRTRCDVCKAAALRVLWIPQWSAQRTFGQNRKV